MVPHLHTSQPFPAVHDALGVGSDAPGLLCAGADLSLERLVSAYSHGIFPWFSDGQPVLWWSTDPRMVLHVIEFRLAPSLKKRIRQLWRAGRLQIRVDFDPIAVMRACSASTRNGQSGTWIVEPMLEAYTQLARAGHVHSVEAWIDGELAGGLYCVGIGRAVFGESMFHRASDASKIALSALVAMCADQGVERIDCQQETAHLASMGARPIARAEFVASLPALTALPPMSWAFEPRHWTLYWPEPADSHALPTPVASPSTFPPAS